jgi:predicted transcriptional regulator
VQHITLNAVTYAVPHAGLLRAHTAAERSGLAASIRAARGVLQPVLTYDSDQTPEPCVLDGALRLQLAAQMGLEAVPIVHLGPLSSDEANAWALSLNVHRRHLSPQEQTEARASRMELVASLASAGMPQRMMAKLLGVSQAQITLDVAKVKQQSEHPCSPEDQNVRELSAAVRAGAKLRATVAKLLEGENARHLRRHLARHQAELRRLQDADASDWVEGVMRAVLESLSDFAAESHTGFPSDESDDAAAPLSAERRGMAGAA